MRSDDGDAAAALLAVLRPDIDDMEIGELVRAYVGASLIVDALGDLRILRKALTKPE